MVRKAIIVLFVFISILSINACNTAKGYVPRFWVWIHAHTDYNNKDWNDMFSKLDSIGVKGVLIGADRDLLNIVIPIATEYDIEIHAWTWTMNRADAPDEFLSVNALGKSLSEEKAYVDYYKFMCPALPEVHEFIKSNIEEFGLIDGLAGVHMDYIRYVDVFLPIGLQPKYGIVQDSIMPEYDYGYHPYIMKSYFEKYGIHPFDIPDYLNDTSWQQFRMDKVTEVVNEIAELPQFENMCISAAVFPDPEMSQDMVRQDWAKWNLDYFFPMVYYNFYNEDVEWIGEVIGNNREVLPNSKIFCGLYIPSIKQETEVYRAIEIAMESGASGISFFDYRALKPHHFRAIKKATRKYGIYLSE